MYSGSPHRERNMKDSKIIADDKRKWEDGKNLSGRSDKHSSRSYHRHDDRNRHDKHVDDYDRGYSKSSHRSGRDSRDKSNMDHSRSDKDHRSRDYVKDVNTHSLAKSDGSGNRNRDKDTYERAGSGRKHANIEERDRDRERDRYREERERHVKTDGSPAYEDSRGQQHDSSSRRDSSGHLLKEGSRRDGKELDADKYASDEKWKHDDISIYKEQGYGVSKEHSEDTSIKSKDSVTKKPKFSSLNSTGPGTDGMHYLLQSLAI